jgi:hypothetical protein
MINTICFGLGVFTAFMIEKKEFRDKVIAGIKAGWEKTVALVDRSF